MCLLYCVLFQDTPSHVEISFQLEKRLYYHAAVTAVKNSFLTIQLQKKGIWEEIV